MFQFRAFPAYDYLIHRTLTRYCRAGFPHSEISGSMRMCRSPKLIAACRVLLRLLMPRHSPCALISLTYVGCAVAACEASLAMLRRFAPAILLFRSKPASLGFGSSGRTFFLRLSGSQLELCRSQKFRLHCSFVTQFHNLFF